MKWIKQYFIHSRARKIAWLLMLGLVTFVVLSFVILSKSIHNKANLKLAETFIDAFYSFQSTELDAILVFAPESISSIAFYQGWAEGGHYKIIDRQPCEFVQQNRIDCSITVEDDLMLALGIDFNVTDKFHLDFLDGKIISVRNSSNDLPVFSAAIYWVNKEWPALSHTYCRGFFNGGSTPKECVVAMVKGFKKFSHSAEFQVKYRE